VKTRDAIVVPGDRAVRQDRRVAPRTNWVAFSAWAKAICYPTNLTHAILDAMWRPEYPDIG
jgi:hypothetical protein